MIDRIPPHNLEAEQSVLGSVLLDNEVLSYIVDNLQPEDFYKEAHKKIFHAFLHLYERDEPIDLVTLTEHLRQQGTLERIGNVPYLIGLADGVPTAAYAENYARIVREKSLRRQFIAQHGELMNLAYNEEKSIRDLVDAGESRAYEFGKRLQNSDNTFTPAPEIANQVLEYVENVRTQPEDTMPGVSTGLRDIDDMTGGLIPGGLYIVAGRPSMGKTAWAIKAALSVASQGSTLVFSLEMSTQQLGERMMSILGAVRADKIKRPHTLSENDLEKLATAGSMLTSLGIHVDDTPSLDIMTLRSRARERCSRLGNVKLIVLDYLQIMAIEDKNRVQEVGAISRQLKQLARELDVPILVLSQLSRAVEQRSDKRPVLSDLRESGEIEQNADLVGFLYRHEYYYPEDESNKGIAEFIIAKQRGGAIGTVKLQWSPAFTRFADLIQV